MTEHARKLHTNTKKALVLLVSLAVAHPASAQFISVLPEVPSNTIPCIVGTKSACAIGCDYAREFLTSEPAGFPVVITGACKPKNGKSTLDLAGARLERSLFIEALNTSAIDLRGATIDGDLTIHATPLDSCCAVFEGVREVVVRPRATRCGRATTGERGLSVDEAMQQRSHSRPAVEFFFEGWWCWRMEDQVVRPRMRGGASRACR